MAGVSATVIVVAAIVTYVLPIALCPDQARLSARGFITGVGGLTLSCLPLLLGLAAADFFGTTALMGLTGSVWIVGVVGLSARRLQTVGLSPWWALLNAALPLGVGLWIVVALRTDRA